ncbi:hypothetical protein ERJ75_000359300 [Trypanosoma vivax]|nr:hypothetical protein ERJ75_000359300 [Trypanosoma vivax]
MEALREMEQEKTKAAIEASRRSYSAPSHPARPLLGGYVHPPWRTGTTKFCIFPQSGHDVSVGPSTQQEVPFFVRGTFCRQVSPVEVQQAEWRSGAGLVERWLNDIVFNFTVARKFSATREKSLPALFANVDAIHVDVYANNVSTEHFCALGSGNVQQTDTNTSTEVTAVGGDDAAICGGINGTAGDSVVLRGSGVRASLQSHDPRYALTVDGIVRTPKCDTHASPTVGSRTIASLLLLGEYDSSVQRFTSPLLHRYGPYATYLLQCSAGPGVEFSNNEKCLTLFGRIVSNWRLEFPLLHDKLLFLRLRSNSALVVPIANCHGRGLKPTEAVSSGSNAHDLF